MAVTNPDPRKKRRVLLIVLATVGGLLVLCCIGGAIVAAVSPPKPKMTAVKDPALKPAAPATPAPVKSTPATLATPPVVAAPKPGIVHPDNFSQGQYVAEVRAIDPALAAKPDRTVSHGRNICLDLAGSRETAIQNAAKRDGVSIDVAGRLVDAARKYFCPG